MFCLFPIKVLLDKICFINNYPKRVIFSCRSHNIILPISFSHAAHADQVKKWTFYNQRLTVIIVLSFGSLKLIVLYLALGVLLASDCQCHDHKLDLTDQVES